jgi:hypothetical protein
LTHEHFAPGFTLAVSNQVDEFDMSKDDQILSDAELEAIRQRCEQATPGPWKSFVEGRDHSSGSSFIMTRGEDIELSGATSADQDFIAHARQDIPRLLAEIHRLKAG